MEQQIIYSIAIKQSALTCCVCLENINFPIIQCANGSNPHFICMTCQPRVNQKCPQCKTKSLFYNKQLQVTLAPFLESCTNEYCKMRMFQWNLNEHVADCDYKKHTCFICRRKGISRKTMQSHFETKCNTQIVQRNMSSIEVSGWELEKQGYKWI